MFLRDYVLISMDRWCCLFPQTKIRILWAKQNGYVSNILTQILKHWDLMRLLFIVCLFYAAHNHSNTAVCFAHPTLNHSSTAVYLFYPTLNHSNAALYLSHPTLNHPNSAVCLFHPRTKISPTQRYEITTPFKSVPTCFHPNAAYTTTIIPCCDVCRIANQVFHARLEVRAGRPFLDSFGEGGVLHCGRSHPGSRDADGSNGLQTLPQAQRDRRLRSQPSRTFSDIRVSGRVFAYQPSRTVPRI